ncbi:P63C domain-containing protein [Seohaeicola nanhaiensis]|uniref:P63C domain-containing protein n=1 Tax=Seohaeicola nanhaiensis TaxID=1387282 RepID=A0ABV9KKQ4_9RHOB
MPDDKKDVIEPIDATFEDVVGAVAPKAKKATKAVLETNSANEPSNEATHRGTLRIGSVSIPCAVLRDGTRVLSENGIANALGGRSGAAKRMKTAAAEAGAHIPVFLAAKSLSSYVTSELASGPLKPISYISGDTEVIGYQAEALPEICNIWLQARQDGVLNEQQNDRAQAAEIVMRGLANLGVIALIDEATGYQDTRDRDALQAILDKYLQKEFAAWAKRFPDAFYREIFRLRGWSWNAMSVARPGVVGRYTNDIVYERLAPGILEELQRLNPTQDEGGRARKHHQFLTDDIGHPALAQHLHAVIGLMRASATWEQFRSLLDRAFPKKGAQLELLLDEDQ